jgi:hypothetical protein
MQGKVLVEKEIPEQIYDKKEVLIAEHLMLEIGCFFSKDHSTPPRSNNFL